MPTLKDRPGATEVQATKTDEGLSTAPPVERITVTRRPERYVRWIGWLVVLAIAALAIGVTTVVVTDDAPTADLAATLEKRVAKDAIEEHQQAVLSGVAAAPAVDQAALRLEQLVRKDAIEEKIATTQLAAAVALSDLDARMLKEKIEESLLP